MEHVLIDPAFKPVPLLETLRLYFREWTYADLPLATNLWGDPRVTRLIDVRERLSREDVSRRLSREIACAREHGVQYWPIFLKNNHEHVGCCGLRPYDPGRKVYEVGAHIVWNHWGRGLASEAISSVMAHAFGVRSVAALFAGHNPHNKVSRHLLQKLGFRYTHDEYYKPTGLQHPSYLMTADEYRDWSGRRTKVME